MTTQELNDLKTKLKELKTIMCHIEKNTNFMSNNESKAKKALEAIDTVLFLDQSFKVTK